MLSVNLGRTISALLLSCFVLVLTGTVLHTHETDLQYGPSIGHVHSDNHAAECEFCKVTKYKVLYYSPSVVEQYSAPAIYAEHAPTPRWSCNIAIGPSGRAPPTTVE